MECGPGFFGVEEKSFGEFMIGHFIDKRGRHFFRAIHESEMRGSIFSFAVAAKAPMFKISPEEPLELAEGPTYERRDFKLAWGDDVVAVYWEKV